jgi:hypothetical protein
MGIREKRYPPYIMINPAAAAATGADGDTAAMPEMPPSSPDSSPAESWVASERVVPDEEAVEEFFEE